MDYPTYYAVDEDLSSEVSSLREANALKDQEIGAYQDRIEHLQEFIRKFLDNFEDCENCGGTGFDKAINGTCLSCRGEEHVLVSRGVLYNELFHEAISLLSGAAQ